MLINKKRKNKEGGGREGVKGQEEGEGNGGGEVIQVGNYNLECVQKSEVI